MGQDAVDELVGFAAVAGILLAGGLTIGATIENHNKHVDCLRTEEVTGIETKIEGPLLGKKCFIKINDSFIPLESWRNFE